MVAGRLLLNLPKGDSSSDPGGDSSSDSDPSTDSDSDALPFSTASALTSRKGRAKAIDEGMERNGLAIPMSKQFIRNLMSQAGKNGSAYEVYKYDVHFKKDRNKRECMSLARILDSLLSHDYIGSSVRRSVVV